LGGRAPDPKYETVKAGVRVYIVAETEGRLKDLAHIDEIKALDSYTRMSLHVEPGRDVVKTTDLSNDAGWIDLTNVNPKLLREDEKRLDQLLDAGVLIFENVTPTNTKA
jgi:hypothetical protein